MGGIFSSLFGLFQLSKCHASAVSLLHSFVIFHLSAEPGARCSSVGPGRFPVLADGHAELLALQMFAVLQLAAAEIPDYLVFQRAKVKSEQLQSLFFYKFNTFLEETPT